MKKLPSGYYEIFSAFGSVIYGEGQIESFGEGITACPPIIEQFWSLETIGIKKEPEETEDEVAMKQFISSIR